MSNSDIPTLAFSCSSTSTQVTTTIRVSPNGSKTGDWDFVTFNGTTQVDDFQLPTTSHTIKVVTGEKILTYITHSGDDTNGQLIVENPAGAPYSVTCSTAHPTEHTHKPAGGGAILGILAFWCAIWRARHWA